MKKLSLLAILGALALSGCAGGNGPSSIGSGSEEILNGTRLEGLYLFKIDASSNVINVRSGRNTELKL